MIALAQLLLIVASWSNPEVAAWSPRDIALLQTANGVALALVGFVIVTKRRGNVVGWLLLTAGVVVLGWWLASEYAAWGLIVAARDLPGAGAAALLSGRLWVIPFGCVIVMLLVFPTGRLLSRAWWPAVAASVAAMALVVPLIATVWDQRGAGRDLVGDTWATDLPAATEMIDFVVSLCLGLSLLAAVASLVVRWRRSREIERHQLKWLMFAAIVTLAAVALDSAVPSARVLFLLAFVSIPVAVGIAVMRYRLYEIDRIIRRTVTYAVITALAAVVYAVVVVLPSVVLEIDSDLLVAAATLIAVAAFRPLKERVTKAVDRRFNRSRYDAETTVQAFAARLRFETNIDYLSADILHVVRATLQPSCTGLLLRDVGGLSPMTPDPSVQRARP
jgi:hypothetical protein